MPLFALSWNIICIGFILAMNFFAVDYALHLLGINKSVEAKCETIRSTNTPNNCDSIHYFETTQAHKNIDKAHAPYHTHQTQHPSPYYIPIVYSDHYTDRIPLSHTFSLSRRGPPTKNIGRLAMIMG